MSGATKYLDTLIEGYGLTLFIAVHMGKDHSRGARGHSLVAGWRDTKFTLTRDKNGLTVTVDPRWGASLNPLKLNFRDGTLLEGDAPRWTKQAEGIRALLSANQGRLSREAIGLGLDLKGSALRTALMRAQAKGAIHVDDDVVTLPPSPPSSPNHPF